MNIRALVHLVIAGSVIAPGLLLATDPPNGLSGTFGESGKGDGGSVLTSTGAMTYALPFRLPANRGNSQPALSLTYGSTGGIGEAGLGWSLRLPTIERAPLSGWPKYIDDGSPANEDRFTYSGQALTFICVVDGAPACPVNERVGPMPAWANGYRHYRLQVEGSLDRFFWDVGNSRWIVQERGGNLLEFGLALTRPDLQLASAYETDAPSGRTFRWYLAVQRDLHAGRNIAFYRWASDGQGSRKYLREIFYGPPPASAAVAPLSDFAFHVELRWENPPYRQKDVAFADRRPHYKRLRRIAISAKTWAGAGDRELVRAYNLTYFADRGETLVAGEAPLWGRSSLRSVQVEGRCSSPIQETAGSLPDPTNCPVLPPVIFEYSSAALASGAATFVPLGTPGTTEVFSYPTSSAVLDVNRDGRPDVIQAWPTNYRQGGFRVEYNECRDGDFLVDAGANPQDLDPQLVCRPDEEFEDTFDVRSARAQKAWINRGTFGGPISMQHTCLDAGGVEPKSPAFYQITGPQGFGSREPSMFTQYGAEAIGQWGNGAVLWSLAGYHAFGFAPAKLRVPGAPFDSDEYDAATYLKFCPESAANPAQPALRWLKTGTGSWSKDPQNNDRPEAHHFTIVDIDADGYPDLLTEPTTAGTDGAFERAAVRFTRKISRQDNVDFTAGPGLFPFTSSGGAAITVAPTFAQYSTYADINGDGIPDLITGSTTQQNGVPEVRLGNGRGGFGCELAADIACQIAGNGPGAGDWLGRAYLLFTPDTSSIFDPRPWPLVKDFAYSSGPGHYFHDVTGDGLADIIKYEPPSDTEPGKVRLWVNVDGRTFRCAKSRDCVVAIVGGPGLPTPDAIGTHKIVFADMDGNGTEDFLLLSFKGMWTFSFLKSDPVPAVGPRSPRPGLLTRIRNGVGADTEVTYQTTQELDLAANSADPDSFSSPWASHLPEVVPVVTRLTTRDSASVKGTPLPQPFGLNRSRRFEYRDPAYDPWERAFKGFSRVRSINAVGEVTQTWFYFGACESGPFLNPACLRGSDGGNDGAGNSDYLDRSLVGAVVRVDHFRSGGGDRPIQWLSTRTTTYDVDASFIQPPGPRPDRPVALARVARVDTFLYDTGAAVSLVNKIDRPTAPQFAPRQQGRVHLRSDVTYDGAGSVLVEKQYGRINENTVGPSIDSLVTTTYRPAQGRCGANWQCLAVEVIVSELLPGMIAERQLRHTRFQHNTDGDLTLLEGRLFATSSEQPGLERDLTRGTGAPSSAQITPGWKTLRIYEVDNVGNVTVTRGDPISNQACSSTEYDASFRQFAATITQFSGSGCTGKRLTEQRVFDRGLGLVIESRSADRSIRTMSMDAFGRLERINDAAPEGNTAGTELAVEYDYHTQEPVSWVETRRRVDIDQFVSSIKILNGVSEPVLGFEQADVLMDGAPWVANAWTERDNNGRLTVAYRPWFFTGDARAVANTAPALAPPGLKLSTFRDTFGRPTITFDGALATSEYTYLPLTVAVKDAERRKPAGPFSGLESVTKKDGHGRTIETITPSNGDRTTTRVEYLGTGEMTKLRRSSDQAAIPYERSIHWDSFGRLIVNSEPNSSGPDAAGVRRAWRYVYDSEGRIVGTSDARGCGKNLFYDAVGRIRAEDFSPCAESQVAYTEPDLTTGNGTEAFYRYDSYEVGAILSTPTFSNSPEAAIGRLVSVEDLGAATRFSYDRRGRVRRTERQIVKPGPPQAALGDRYVNHWFSQETQFDLGDRLRKRTLGLEGSEFPTGSFESFSFSARGLVHEIGSSFGVLASELKTLPGGQLFNAKYGDLAGTRTQKLYDTRERLLRWRTSRTAAPALWALPSSGTYPKPDADTTQLLLTDLEFSYDDVGNVTSIIDGSADTWPQGATPVSRVFQYDPGYRLSQVDYSHGSAVPAPTFLAEAQAQDNRPIAERLGQMRIAQQSFVTDWQGNMTQSEDNESLRFDRSLGQILNSTGVDNQPRGPNQLIDAEGIHGAYDAAGNLTEITVARDNCWDRMPLCSHRFRYDWDEVGQLARARRWDFPEGSVPAFDAATAPAWDLTYAYSEGERTRISAANHASTVEHTLDVFDTLRVNRTSYQSTTSTYLLGPEFQLGFAGGVARVFFDRRRLLPMAGSSPLHVYLNIGDYLGSSGFLLDKDSGEVVERTTYQPFGAVESDYRPERWGSVRENFKFTGKEEDTEVGATYFGARYYNSRLGRWMSPDPMTIHGLTGDPNPYAYVNGQVMNFTDQLGTDKIPTNLTDVQFHPESGGWSGVNPDGTFEFGNAEGPAREPVSTERLTDIQRSIDRFETEKAVRFANKLVERSRAREAYHERMRARMESRWADVYLVLDILTGGDGSLPLEEADPDEPRVLEGAATPIPQAAALEVAASRALTVHRITLRPTQFNRARMNFSAAEKAAFRQPAGTLCPACQARPIAEGGHATPAVQIKILEDIGMITEQEANAIARSQGNYIDLCKSCNRSQGSKLMGNQPGHWMPPNARPDLLDYLRSLGAIQ